MGKGGSVDGVLVPKDEGTRPLNNVKQEQTHLAKQQESTGKAEYSERGPLSLREHGGETYS
ncbi:hypothetical protein Krac_0514 [Ktedonobacter racemifer DSM 44963]|uniref:Uncharacterized protein n=2 Tax=Ktedonobacter racemifer DSM 44963 TaxID=485913 RepID=D6U7X0_KTERA|nr:hypothetical protein Krac_0514 [Ktedonobacter racemifer DSM 44963]